MTEFDKALRKNMVLFLGRNVNLPFSNPLYASYEVELLLRCDNEKEYLRASRLGKRVKLGRELRKIVWSHWERAFNHTDFEVNYVNDMVNK